MRNRWCVVDDNDKVVEGGFFALGAAEEANDSWNKSHDSEYAVRRQKADGTAESK